MFKFLHSKYTETSLSTVPLRHQYTVSRDEEIKNKTESQKAVHLTSISLHYFFIGITTT